MKKIVYSMPTEDPSKYRLTFRNGCVYLEHEEPEPEVDITSECTLKWTESESHPTSYYARVLYKGKGVMALGYGKPARVNSGFKLVQDPYASVSFRILKTCNKKD